VPYEYHIGVDYHKSYSHLVVQDSGGKTLRSGRVKNDRQSVASFLDRYKDNSHAVVEATHNWMVMYDWLDDICEDVVLAHPLKVKAIADTKIKTDKIDATVLAHLLRADPIKVDAFAPVCSPRLAIAGLEDIRRVALIHVDGRTAPLPLPDWPRWCSEAGINGVNTTVGFAHAGRHCRTGSGDCQFGAGGRRPRPRPTDPAFPPNTARRHLSFRLRARDR